MVSEVVGIVLIRAMIVLGALMCITFGYRLFRIVATGQGEIRLRGDWGLSIVASGLAPGVIFAAFGAVVLAACLFHPMVFQTYQEGTGSRLSPAGISSPASSFAPVSPVNAASPAPSPGPTPGGSPSSYRFMAGDAIPPSPGGGPQVVYPAAPSPPPRIPPGVAGPAPGYPQSNIDAPTAPSATPR